MMKKIIIFLSIMALSLTYGAIHLFSKNRSAESTLPSEASSNPAEAAKPGIGQINNGNSAEAPRKTDMRLPLEGVRTFGELQHQLLSRRDDEPTRLSYLLMASTVCEGYPGSRFDPRTSSPQSAASTKYFSDRVGEFCSDLSGGSEEWERRLLIYENSDIVQARELLTLAADGLNSETHHLGESIVLTSNNASAIYYAAAALASDGRWQFGKQLAATPQEKAALPKSQWIAAQMLACDLSGGCSQGGLTTLIECGSYGLCSPNITARALLEKTSMQIQFDLALKIYRQLLQDRRDADLPKFHSTTTD